jgi:hypothetical protein
MPEFLETTIDKFIFRMAAAAPVPGGSDGG